MYRESAREGDPDGAVTQESQRKFEQRQEAGGSKENVAAQRDSGWLELGVEARK